MQLLAFSYNATFNQDIGSWNVSGVTDMAFMFFTATNFNQNISLWDVPSVTNMDQMFTATVFNQDIGLWDISALSASISSIDSAAEEMFWALI